MKAYFNKVMVEVGLYYELHRTSSDIHMLAIAKWPLCAACIREENPVLIRFRVRVRVSGKV